MTELQLIERASKGDQQAFRALYDANVDRIYRLAYRMAGEEDQDFNLVILDLATPGLHGRAVLHQVRGSVETAALPVLIRIATGSDQIEAELLEAGADDYVEKSVDADRFMARVHAVLRPADVASGAGPGYTLLLWIEWG
ncbi:MAG: response regulator [Gemmatimonadetes bacterium]|nr:response regulator [Gemmatimonadota bacterium]